MGEESEEQELSRLFEEGRKRIDQSSVSFFYISNPLRDFPSAGSGTLARISGAWGIVTATHVADELRQCEKIGLAHRNRGKRQGLKIRMDHVRVGARFGEPPWNQSGPDLTFLILPPDTIHWLQAAGCIFLDLESHREKILNEEYQTQKIFWCIAGTISEWTTSKGSTPAFTNIDGYTLIQTVRFETPRWNAEYDYVDCVPYTEPEFKSPTTYKGMSGGGLFVLHVTGEGSTRAVSGINLAGVNFWESAVTDGRRIITCHFMQSIYGLLLAKVKNGLS